MKEKKKGMRKKREEREKKRVLCVFGDWERVDE